MDKIRVVIADDHNLVRAGIRLLLESLEGVKVVGEVGSGEEVFSLIDKTPIDIIFLDLSMPGVENPNFCQKIKEINSKIEIIILSMHLNEEYVRQALKSGAKGYLLKDSAISELEVAIKSVHRGEIYLSPKVSKILAENYLNKIKDPLELLTKRQKEILKLIAEGYSSKEIAGALNISMKTVETHKAQIMEKLNIYDIAGLVKFAIKNGLVKLD